MTTLVAPPPADRRLTGLPTFHLPADLEATVPPEARGITRDAVRMLVATRHDGGLVHSDFGDLPRILDPGDLVVINTSGTLPAAVPAIGPDGLELEVHLSTEMPAGLWSLELRRGDTPYLGADAGERITLPGGGRADLLSPMAELPLGVRLWVASLSLPQPLHTYLAVHGHPIRYSYVRGDWPLSVYQNVYATEPGSAEMPSAGRPFTPEIITRLVAKGVGVTPGWPHRNRPSHRMPSSTGCRRPPLDGSTPPTPTAAGSSPSGPRWCGPWRPSPMIGATSIRARDGPRW
jgi:S-adenosylmethionine:tRNA ribosyltransferase-isomerase